MEAESGGSIRKILITGGAGYIGSTVASACADRGITPVILDNLTTGRAEFIQGHPFFEGDICDGPLLDKVFAEHPDIYAVVHCAALIVVPDSVTNPIGYYQANVTKSLDLVRHLVRNGCRRLVFSSSAAIYSPGEDLSVTEESPIGPLSPYARTLSLRYFNPIGADPKLRTGLALREPTHALGQLVRASQTGMPFRITGTDYPSRDGSGIRDYLHVWDLAEAHLVALESFDRALADRTSEAVNLGTGRGTTVRELVALFNEVSDTPVQVVEAPRRPGDQVGAYARCDKAAELLGWQSRFSIAEGIADSLRWAEVRDDILTAS
jgi:UDP-glucose 4-epimerase